MPAEPPPTYWSIEFYVGRRFVILHGFRKKSQKTPIREIATAERRMADFLEKEHDS
jgi:phage-related protein